MTYGCSRGCPFLTVGLKKKFLSLELHTRTIMHSLTTCKCKKKKKALQSERAALSELIHVRNDQPCAENSQALT